MLNKQTRGQMQREKMLGKNFRRASATEQREYAHIKENAKTLRPLPYEARN